MLEDISKMEQRYDAVTMVMRDGFSITDIAAKFNVSRRTVYRWFAKYEEGGLEALAGESHRPRHVPHQMDGAVEMRVLEMRQRHPLWGPQRIPFELKKAAVGPPRHMAIYRALVRAGPVVKGKRKKVLRTYKRWERGKLRFQALAKRDHRVAQASQHHRTDGVDEHLGQARPARGVGLPVLSQLPNSSIARRRQAQLGSICDDHTPRKSEDSTKSQVNRASRRAVEAASETSARACAGFL